MSLIPDKYRNPVLGLCLGVLAVLVTVSLGLGIGYWWRETYPPAPMQAPKPPKWTWMKLKFSPKGGATDQVVKAIKQARSEVLVMAFSFTSEPIAQALVDAKARGVDVMLILDEGANKPDSRTSKAAFVASKGYRVWLDGKHAIMHNKIMIFDGEAVLTGSFNFTKSAEESNAENSVPILEAAKVDAYVENWKKHVWHCEAWPGHGQQED